MNTTNKKLSYGKKNLLTDEKFDPSKAKVRISIMIDGDILEAFKKMASKAGGKYQSLMNQKLRDTVESQGLDAEMKSQIRSMIRDELKKKAS